MAVDRASPSLRTARVGARVSLLDVRLRRIDAELLDPAAEGPFNLSIQIRPTFDRHDPMVIYTVEYDLEATTEAGPVFRSEIAFLMLYELRKDADISDEELAAFGEVNVAFSAHPYIRELAQTLTGRFGLPPLVLEVMQSPLDSVLQSEPD